jgi:hypothetical protein
LNLLTILRSKPSTINEGYISSKHLTPLVLVGLDTSYVNAGIVTFLRLFWERFMRNMWVATATALITAPLMALPAGASSCVQNTAANYEAAGFSCNVGPVTFSNIVVTTIGTVTLGDFTPFSAGGEYGLTLNYAASTNAANPNADVSWTYEVTGNLGDAYLSFNGDANGTGTSSVNETLTNAQTLVAFATLYADTTTTSDTVTFAPIGDVLANKDQQDVAGPAGYAESSSLTNAFSVATPLPGTFPLLASGLVGLWALRRKRKQSPALAA